MIKKLFAFLVLACAICVGQNIEAGSVAFSPLLVSTLPTASSNNGRVFLVTDGASAGDCTTGGGSNPVLCRSNGTVYASLPGIGSFVSGNGITSGVSGFPVYPSGVANTLTPSTAYIDAWVARCSSGYSAGADVGTCVNYLTTNFPTSVIDLRGLPAKMYLNSPLITPAAFLLTAVANASGGNTTYTGTFPVASMVSACAAPPCSITIAGFTTSANNGNFQIISSTSTTLVVANASGAAGTCPTNCTNATSSATRASSDQFSGTLILGNSIFFINNVTGLQTFGGGINIEGNGRSNNGTGTSTDSTSIPYNSGTGTDFELCSTHDTLVADYTTLCGSTAYTAVLTADGNNYPAIITMNGYLPSAGAVGTIGATQFASRITGITVGCGMQANSVGFANASSQEGSFFNNFYWHDCTAAGSIGVDFGMGTGGAQNFWATDCQGSTIAGKTNAFSAVGIRIWASTGNGLPSGMLRCSVVNNAGGNNPNYDFEYVGGTQNVGEFILGYSHFESATIAGIAAGVVTVKGTDQGGAANGLLLIDDNGGPGFSTGAGTGFIRVFSNANLSGALVTNLQILGTGATGQGSAPTNLIADDNNTAIPIAIKFVARYETDGTITGGKIISDTSNTNTTPLNGAQLPTSANGVSTNSSKQLVASTAHNTSVPLVCAAASGSGSAYTCSTSPTFVPADGDLITFQADVASAGAVTLVVNGQAGTPAVQKAGGSTDPIVANDFRVGGDYSMEFDGTNWQLLSATGNDPTNASNLTSGNISTARISSALAAGTIPGSFTTLTYGSLAAVNAHVSNVTAVTVSNPTAATDTILMALSLPASYFVSVGQPYTIHGSGVLSTTAASVPLVTITPKLCSVAGCATGTVTPLAAIQSAALNTTALTNATWVFNAVATVASTGASCNLIVKGTLTIETGASVAAADSIYADSNIATSSPNQTCTNALFLDFFVQQSTTGASNSYKQLMGVISPLP